MASTGPQSALPKNSFLFIEWLSWAVATNFLMLRLYLRIKTFWRLQVDDYLAITAWTLFLAHNLVRNTQLSVLYAAIDFEKGKLPADSVAFRTQVQEFARSMVASNVLYISSLWSVKLGFLVFFRKMLAVSKGRTIWWWVVLTITMGSWVASIADLPFDCFFGSYLYLVTYCWSSSAAKTQGRAFLVNTCLDIATNILILTLPVLILHRVRISPRKKLGLLGLVSLTVFTMVFALVRLLVSPQGTVTTNMTWAFSWNHLEMSMALIVTCLGSFRQLYTKSKKRKKEHQHRPTYRTEPRRARSIFPITKHAESHVMSGLPSRPRPHPAYSGDDKVTNNQTTVSRDGASKEKPVATVTNMETCSLPKDNLVLYADNDKDIEAGNFGQTSMVAVPGAAITTKRMSDLERTSVYPSITRSKVSDSRFDAVSNYPYSLHCGHSHENNPNLGFNYQIDDETTFRKSRGSVKVSLMSRFARGHQYRRMDQTPSE